MSRAFVKEDGPEPDDNPAEKPTSPHPNYITRRGERLLQQEQERLVGALAEFTGAQDDPARRRRKRELERDLRYVRARLDAAILVDASLQPKDRVLFGCALTLRAEDGRPFKLRVVGEDEAEGRDEGWSLIPWPAPLANALMGLKTGDSLDWDLGNGERRWTVESILRESDRP
ncbi:MAG: GreA/GreB family elongation factor [Elusimicrobia bacterium]|nr:GreA/GreB family elongation factor [Elusimicrobiota bacterium]